MPGALREVKSRLDLPGGLWAWSLLQIRQNGFPALRNHGWRARPGDAGGGPGGGLWCVQEALFFAGRGIEEVQEALFFDLGHAFPFPFLFPFLSPLFATGFKLLPEPFIVKAESVIVKAEMITVLP
jgi:hypothetical protein